MYKPIQPKRPESIPNGIVVSVIVLINELIPVNKLLSSKISITLHNPK
jgi:hypothetical protein